MEDEDNRNFEDLPDSIGGGELDDHDYEYSSVEFQPSKLKGPLDHIPAMSTAFPAFVMFCFFGVASTLYWNHPFGKYLWVSRESIYENGEMWRLLTSLFVHGDFVHLLSNSPLFLIFGWILHAFFGKWIFPVVGLVIGVISNLATIYYMPDSTRLVGASGMLYGMVGLWLVLYVRFDVHQKISVRIFRAAAFSLLVLAPTTYHPTTSYLAHGFGFFFGIVSGYIASTLVTPKTPKALEIKKHSVLH